jgi:undecaprenyl-diphosphatase
VYAFLIILAYFFFIKKQKSKLLHLIVAFIIGELLVLSMKYVIDRPRPLQTYTGLNGLIEKSDPSFPSGHTFLAFFCLYFIFKNFKRFKYPLAIYLGLLLPFGPMYLNIHFFSDVVVGAAIGLLVPMVVSEKLTSRLAKKISF